VKVKSQVEKALEITAIPCVFARSLYDEISPAIAQLEETMVTACHEMRRFLQDISDDRDASL